MEQQIAEEVAEILLKIGAFKFNAQKPYQWASGCWMPVYNDNRLLLKNPMHRGNIAFAFKTLIEKYAVNPDIIGGIVTSGIPHATTLADDLLKPLIYIRDKPKEHGLRNRIEGIDAESGLEGKSVLLIEDLVSFGRTSASAVQAIRDAKGICNFCFSIFSYGFEEAEKMFAGQIPFDAAGNCLNPACTLKSLLDYDILLRVALKKGKINYETLATLKEWREDYAHWGEKHGFPRTMEK